MTGQSQSHSTPQLWFCGPFKSWDVFAWIKHVTSHGSFNSVTKFIYISVILPGGMTSCVPLG